MVELIMLCGIPTSGKSTYVEESRTYTIWNNVVLLSTDSFIEREARKLSMSYNEAFESLIGPANKQLEIDLTDAIRNDKNLLWDQTNLTIRNRKKKLSKVPSSYRKTAIYFPITLEEALDRNKHREGKFIPESVITSMFNQLEPPTVSEGFDNVHNSKNWT